MKRTSILPGICIVVATLVVAIAGMSLTLAWEGERTTVVAGAPTPSTTSSTPTTAPPTTSTTRAPATTTTSMPPTTTTVAPTTTTTVAPTTTTTAPAPPAPATLRRGDRGPAVAALQDQLHALGYWLGARNDVFGLLTEQAVTAFQKVEGLARDGIVGPATREALAAATRPTTTATGDLVEVDKARQVLFVVRDGAVAWVFNTSTGTERPYQINGRTELADTPPGRWTVDWVVDGNDVGELGALYRPRYFHADGIAVHGYHSVPNYPASHGCVRVTEAAMDWIWSQHAMPVGSAVWVH